jgi:hypothetical protein
MEGSSDVIRGKYMLHDDPSITPEDVIRGKYMLHDDPSITPEDVITGKYMLLPPNNILRRYGGVVV